jgi:hypothetical protein
MTRTKLNTPAFADQSVDSRNIADGAVQAQDITDGTVSANKLTDTLDLSSKTVTLPNTSVANTKLANSAFTINGSSVALGASLNLTVFVEWQAVTVADGSTTLTAQAGKGYFLDTNAGVIEVFLPTSPSRGDTVVLVDYAGHFALNRLLINTGTQKLGSVDYPEYKVETNNSIVQLVYVDSTKGWQVTLSQAAGTTPSSALTLGQYDPATFISATGGTVTTDGDFKVHAFTGDGNFVVSAVGNSAGSNKVDYLVVAGGGGGGADRAGGGGAGGFRTGQVPGCTGLPVSTTTFPITVGGGGAAGTYPNATPGCAGSNSVFSTITSAGGGTGAKSACAGGNGGSGGGGGGGPPSAPGSAGGSGNTPSVSPPQGNNGGTGSSGNSPTDTDTRGSGGGGGAGAVGGNAVTGSYPGSGAGGDGGAGSPITAIFGSAPKPFYGPTNGVYAGGGGGGTRIGTNTGGDGGAGGGGDGGDPNAPTAGAGVVNTGGGGGGAEGSPTYDGAAGGSGIVLIRYKFQ